MGKKVSELNGAELDYWVAKAEMVYEQYVSRRKEMGDPVSIVSLEDWISFTRYSPSTDWSQGGPIIEREKIESHFNPYAKKWIARYFDGNRFVGETLLIAAMRAYVASKFREEVPDET